MSRRGKRAAAVPAVVAAIGLTAAVAGVAGCGEPVRPANVVLISVDTLNRSTLAAFDPAAPPRAHLDRLAARARVFPGALTPAPWTLPAQASLLTGRYPSRHGATEVRRRIDPASPTLAGAFRAAGFETVGLTDAGFVDWWFGFDAGFDVYDNKLAESPTAGPRTLPREGMPEDVHGEALFDRALAYLDQRRAGDPPFFLFLHTYAVHDYFALHPWAAGELPAPPPHPGEHYLGCLLGEHACSPEDWWTLGLLYEAEVRHLDRGIGRLLEALDRHRLTGDTLVALTSDHGEGFDPGRGRIHHGGRLHADLLRVPLLIAGPGVEPGRSPGPVSLIDLAPTLLEVAGLAVPEAMDGVSLAPALAGAPLAAGRALFAMDYFHWWHDGRRMDAPEVRLEPTVFAAVRRGRWYLRGPDGAEEVYDTARDPEQRRDLGPGAADGLRELADGWALGHAALQPQPLDPQLEEQLRSLGYLR